MIYSHILNKRSRQSLHRCIQTLLTRRANPDTHDIDGISAIQYLAASWQYESIKLLVDAGVLVHLLRGGDSSNSQSSNKHKHNSKAVNNNALHYAVRGKVIKHIEYLECREHMYNTILQMKTLYSSSSSSATMSDQQQQQQRTTDSTLNKKDSFLQYSTNQYLNIKYGVQTIRVLLQAGLRPNGRNQQGKLPLQLLLKHHKNWKQGNIRNAVFILLQYGARFDLLDSNDQNTIKTKYCQKLTKKIKKPTSNSSEEHDNNEEEEEENNCETETDSEHGHGSEDGRDNDIYSPSATSLAIRNDDEQLYSKETNENMTIEKSIELWANKGDLHVVPIGLR